MFFKECERLAERHPLLAAVIRQVDAQLSKVGAGGIIRSDDLASLLRADPNQVRSILDMLGHSGLLASEEMIECPRCLMAAHRDDYERGLDEDGEYACTNCECPLTDAVVHPLTAYRCGTKWKAVPQVSESPSARLPSGGPALGDQGWYTHVQLADAFEVEKESLRKRLDRYRARNQDGWKENEDRRPREPGYLYQLCKVKSILEELRASSERPAR